MDLKIKTQIFNNGTCLPKLLNNFKTEVLSAEWKSEIHTGRRYLQDTKRKKSIQGSPVYIQGVNHICFYILCMACVQPHKNSCTVN